jgi:hypothetical protein
MRQLHRADHNHETFQIAMQEIKIGINGKIEAGEYQGWYVRIEDDRLGSTGGFYVLIFQSLDPNNKVGYDDWFEFYSSIPGLFEERKWEIRWLG